MGNGQQNIFEFAIRTDICSNQLYKSAVTDEDGIRTVEFKNAKGQTLLTRKRETPTNKLILIMYTTNMDN
ncbi:hypothetical protein EJ377_14520 [Chryseobacterium arthrosphaerae]|uniref:Uncharacterized protein n=1 Tax=Chryseobacterium arthrosphaerae TaxID=651561 RepID=A0A3S0QSM0_9FLAO|nr:hypothetical protein EJ377_14520 [Chryseobacterium arthrosphaerae]